MSRAPKSKPQQPKILIAAGLAFLTLLVYSPALQNSFVNYDDQLYVFENSEVQAGLSLKGIGWAFSTFECANWHPLTWLSLELDSSIYGGPRAGGFHATSIVLHVLNTVLLFFVLTAMTGTAWRSAMVAALFALHPLHVESVAWVAERKDVLSTLFWMLTLAAYLRYVRRPSSRAYLLILICLVLGLLAKPMLVTLPCVLLLLDYWPLHRWKPESGLKGWSLLVREKLPLFAVVAAACVITYIAQSQAKAVGTFEKYPMEQRIANALVAYIAYIGKTVWPVHLAAFYPYPVGGVPLAPAIGAGVALLLTTVMTLRFGRRWPYLPVGWLWFVGTLVPVIGFVQVGEQAMADRYSYVPLIGLFILATWGVADWLQARPVPDVVPAGAGALVLGVCAVLTWKQVGYWKDDVSLWQHTAYATRNNTKAHGNLGEALLRVKGPREALEEYRKSLAIDPSSPDIHFNVAASLRKLGHVEEAIGEYRKALKLDPDYTLAHHNLGAIWLEQGRRHEAIAEFQKAIKLDPDQAPPHFALGALFNDLGQLDEAAREFRRSVDLEPGSVKSYGALAQVMIEQGRYAEAEAAIRRALGVSSNQDLRSKLNAQLVRLRRLRTLESKLPELADGNAKPLDVREELDAAWLCRLPRHALFAGAARLYGAAFKADPHIPQDRVMPFLYWAGCAAAQAGLGLGQDAASLTESEKAQLRAQALAWLREDLTLWQREASSARLESREAAARSLRLYKQDAALAPVRDALAKRPQSERQAWGSFWSQVDETLAAIPP
jgi:tetratricopeptide (TPR) repeat protein